MADDSSKCKAFRSLEWNTELPYSGMDRMSPIFTFRGIRHCFWLRRDSAGHFDVALKLMDEASRSRFTPFSVTVHVELKQGSSTDSVYGPRTVTCNLSSYYMYILKSAITSKVKNDLLHPNMMRLLFTFDNADDLELPGLEDKRENKATQTPEYSDTNVGIQSLSEDLSKLLDDDGSSPDVVLNCGGVAFKAHKNVLSARSKVFRAMLGNEMIEGKAGQVTIADTEADVLGQFLRYLYSGKLEELTVGAATRLYEVGDKYDVQALKRQCASLLADNLSPDNACGVLSLADRHTDTNLKEIATVYILDQKILLQDDIWDDFCHEHPVLANTVFKRFCKLYASCM